MRRYVMGLCAAVLLVLPCWGETLRFHDSSPGGEKAPPFTLEVAGDWKPVDGANASSYHLVAPEETAPLYSRSLSAFATIEDHPLGAKGTADLIFSSLSSKSGNGSTYERVTLGTMPAVLERGKRSFQIWGFSSNSKVSVHYTDGQDSSKPYQGDKVIEEVLRSFSWTR